MQDINVEYNRDTTVSPNMNRCSSSRLEVDESKNNVWRTILKIYNRPNEKFNNFMWAEQCLHKSTFRNYANILKSNIETEWIIRFIVEKR